MSPSHAKNFCMLLGPSGADREINFNEVTPTHARDHLPGFACHANFFIGFAADIVVGIWRRCANHAVKRASQSQHNTRASAAMTQDLDTCVGTLMKKLDELAIANNTYIIYMSDNGGRTDILSGGKGNLGEGGKGAGKPKDSKP